LKSDRYIADIGIIGGTGIYDSGIISDKKEIKVHTPYGEPSDSITIGKFFERTIAFIPRHGKNHRIPPHRINNRANIWALKELGVTRIIAPSAVGSLQKELKPGDIAVPDQFIDFTKARQYTFYDGGQVCHISSSDPFCTELKKLTIDCANNLNYRIHEHVTYVCIEGPRFSTRAESHFFREVMKAHIIGMTLVPECILAREAEICYVSIATITDYDAWTDSPVSSDRIIETLQKNIEKTLKLIGQLIPIISSERTECACGKGLEGALL
jgi:5'-methylthioadenosine phosphorylase